MTTPGDAGLQFALTAAVTSTRERPFPLDAIVRALDWAAQHRIAVAALPEPARPDARHRLPVT